MIKDIIVNGRIFNVVESVFENNYYILAYDGLTVLEDPACEDFYGEIDAVSDIMKEYIREEAEKPFPWFTLWNAIVVKDSNPVRINNREMAERYAKSINNGDFHEVTNKSDIDRAKQKLGLEDYVVSHVFTYNYGS